MRTAMAPGGLMEGMRELQQQGIVTHLGAFGGILLEPIRVPIHGS